MKANLPSAAFLMIALSGTAMAVRLSDRFEKAHGDLLETRREALSGLSDPFGAPLAVRVVLEDPSSSFRREAAWKRNVVTTVFWIGERPTKNNPTPNNKSAWDVNWQTNFGR